MLLTDKEILSALKTGELKLEDFKEQCLEPASYDMRLGAEAFTSSNREKIDLKAKGILTIAPGDFAVVATHEKVELAPTLAGHIGLRSHFARKGLLLLSGPQIDPGFRGVLVLRLCNLGTNDIVIPRLEPLCTVEFHRLNQAVETPYQGPYQDQTSIPSADIETLLETKGMTFGEIVKAVASLTTQVKALTEAVKRLEWWIPLMVGIGIAIIGVITALK